MPQDKVIVFVCEHGAAKSVLAATYFNKLSGEKNLNLRAIARGTHPDEVISPKTIFGLEQDGLPPTESVPQILSWSDVAAAQRIVSFCELPEEYQNEVTVEHWDEIPPVSDNYEMARDAILARLNQLMNDIHSIH
jgi:Protein-tyrosine-phosphatase